MGKTKVLFLEDVGRLGRAGEVREVANGYARNYLLPPKSGGAGHEGPTPAGGEGAQGG